MDVSKLFFVLKRCLGKRVLNIPSVLYTMYARLWLTRGMKRGTRCPGERRRTRMRRSVWRGNFTVGCTTDSGRASRRLSFSPDPYLLKNKYKTKNENVKKFLIIESIPRNKAIKLYKTAMLLDALYFLESLRKLCPSLSSEFMII